MGEAAAQVLINEAPDGSISLKVKLGSETVWLSLNQMAQLFDHDKMLISRHLHNMFREKELEKDSIVAFFALTA
ncbi:MAG: virulence factor, partial [Spirochaetota bacterium]